MTVVDWVRGDALGLQIPAHGEALRAGGEAFLTKAFRAAGAIGPDNSVAQITQLEECPGGSTGRKQWLRVVYEKPEPGLHTDLFVKYSRDFDDEIRDRAKNQMESEVQFALISRLPGFPIAVPACLFADYHHDSGTGVLITQRIPFGLGRVERAWDKCLDYEMPEPLEHYRVLVTAVARLAGAHKAGRLAAHISETFPFDAEKAVTNDRIRYSAQQLQNRVARFSDFAATYPQILPTNIATPEFIAQLKEDVPRFLEHELAIKHHLYSQPDLIALCHWNANVDNAWFWRTEDGELACGLMDWGRVNQMNIALALWGGLSAAEIEIWDNHLDELLALFVAEFRGAGGPVLDPGALKLHICLFAAMMGLAWLMDAPPLIQSQVPDLAEAESRFDARFKGNETARTQLHMLTNFLNLWQTQDFGRMLDRFLLTQAGAA
ncbi:hypothetical protein LJR225_000663 [Phenylobacterium sp. LjRoot225]|uniref:hypothetical protein n=1 Tax=Phenylobacterium sp. LjRoot225 TaxID=3342285 RepID=UPI003ECD62F9